MPVPSAEPLAHSPAASAVRPAHSPLEGFADRITRRPPSALYRLGLTLVALSMVLLAAAYAGLILLVGWGVWVHAVGHVALVGAGFWLVTLLYVGPIVVGVTAGGLVFIGATNYDRKFHAFDWATGELLWEATLPAAGNATPAVYAVDGKQYVAIAAGGGKWGAPSGGSYGVTAKLH